MIVLGPNVAYGDITNRSLWESFGVLRLTLSRDMDYRRFAVLQVFGMASRNLIHVLLRSSVGFRGLLSADN